MKIAFLKQTILHLPNELRFLICPIQGKQALTSVSGWVAGMGSDEIKTHPNPDVKNHAALI